MIFKLKPVYVIGVILGAGFAIGQTTQVDLHNQSKDVDFTSAPFTRPVKTGSTLPSVCTVGDLFFSTGAFPGANLFVCASANTWIHSGEIPSTNLSNLPTTCSAGDFHYITDASFSSGGWRLYSCSAANTFTQVGMVADGTGYLTVTCPQPNNCLVGPNTAVLASLPGANAWTGANDFSGSSKTAAFRTASPAPATCDAVSHESYFNTTTNTVSVCTSTNTWTAIGLQRSFLLYKNNAVGAVTANGSTQTLDSFTIPAGTLQVGDVVEIEANLTRSGTAGPITFGVMFGGSPVPMTTPSSAAGAVFKPTLVVSGAASEQWGGLILAGATSSLVTSVSSAATAAISSAITVSLTQNGTGPDQGAIASWFVKVTR